MSAVRCMDQMRWSFPGRRPSVTQPCVPSFDKRSQSPGTERKKKKKPCSASNWRPEIFALKEPKEDFCPRSQGIGELVVLIHSSLQTTRRQSTMVHERSFSRSTSRKPDPHHGKRKALYTARRGRRNATKCSYFIHLAEKVKRNSSA